MSHNNAIHGEYDLTLTLVAVALGFTGFLFLLIARAVPVAFWKTVFKMLTVLCVIGVVVLFG